MSLPFFRCNPFFTAFHFVDSRQPEGVTRKLLPFLLLLPLFLATSCIEGEEEIWINLNGSGELAARYQFPARALSQIGDPDDLVRALTLIAEKEEGIEISHCSCVTKKGKSFLNPDQATFRIEGEFDNVLELFEIAARNKELFVRETGADPEKVASVIGAVDFRFEGLRPTFDREIRLQEVIPPSLAGVLGSSSFKYIIHLPAEVRDSNAHEVSEDGKTVSWTFLLKDHFTEPMAMSLDTRIPVPWWGWVMVAVLAVLIFGLFWRFVVKRFRRPAIVPAGP